jgi:hypothetical protein
MISMDIYAFDFEKNGGTINFVALIEKYVFSFCKLSP